jgi:hypothetical protein
MSITAGRWEATFAADLGPIPYRCGTQPKETSTAFSTGSPTWALPVPSALHVDATETRRGDRILTFAALTARLYG